MNKFQFFLCALFLMSASTFQAVDIFYEISKGNRRSVKSWLKSSPDLSICNKLGQSVLHAAVLANSDHMVKIVLTSKVPVNALDKTGKTALDYAVDHCKRIFLFCTQNYRSFLGLHDSRSNRPLCDAFSYDGLSAHFR
ncbi:MAG: ankyrin repeat domain-containing protein [Candidatus Dependentiae bacterium]|nr:ankyrin repeat domain-containing protein [Candidatus Dependentiae bacterium]